MEPRDLENELARVHPEGFAWAVRCCFGDRNEAEDVLHLAYVKVLEGRARFEGRSSFKTWLFGVIRRTALEVGRRRTGMPMMTESSNRPDGELRDHFVRERQRDAARTPSFQRVVAPRTISRPGVHRWAVLGFAAAAVAVMMVVVTRSRRSEPSE